MREIASYLITIFFIVLKLNDELTWSWWWVVSPIIFDILLHMISMTIVAWKAIVLDKKGKVINLFEKNRKQ